MSNTRGRCRLLAEYRPGWDADMSITSMRDSASSASIARPREYRVASDRVESGFWLRYESKKYHALRMRGTHRRFCGNYGFRSFQSRKYKKKKCYRRPLARKRPTALQQQHTSPSGAIVNRVMAKK